MLLDMKTLCQYRLDHAKEDLVAAENNYQAGFYMAAIDRSYHAIFHSIRAANALDNFDASKHSSVIAHFNQFYVHTGEFDREIYKLIDSAYRIREKCDFSDFFTVAESDSEDQLKHAQYFVNTVDIYLNQKINQEEM